MLRSFILATVLMTGLTACGQAPKGPPGPPPAVGIYTSASDCADSQKLDIDQCNKLIQLAVDEHKRTAKPYISMRLCEATEGVDRCERTEENGFRVQLQAFLVTFSNPPVAQGLYANADPTTLAFQTLDKKRTLLAVDETLLFSRSSRFVAEGNTKR